MKNFKSIIFFSPEPTVKDAVADGFSTITFIKCFGTENADEVGQILGQSEQSIVFISRLLDIDAMLALQTLHKGNRFKIYFLDERGELTTENIEELSKYGIATLVSTTAADLIERAALIFLGKVRLTGPEEFRPVNPGRFSRRKSYFSHFSFEGGAWRLVASTHEQDLEIETRFRISWTLYCRNLIRRASDIKQPQEDEFFSEDYWEIIWPHQDRDSLRLSIIHVSKDPLLFNELKAKAIIFLKQL